MRGSITLVVISTVLLLGSTGIQNVFAAPVIIDSFDTTQSLLFADFSPPGFDFSSVSGPDIIPLPIGQRDVVLVWSGGTGGVLYEALSGSAFYDEDIDTDGSLELFWDGAGAGLNTDLTDGGANDHFELRISSTTPFDLELDVLDNFDNGETVLLSQPALPGLTVVLIPFSSFPTVDLTAVVEIGLILDTDSIPDTEILIDFLQTAAPAAPSQTQPSQGQLQITEFCLLNVPTEDMDFDSTIAFGPDVSGFFDLEQLGSGESDVSITGDHWFTTEQTPQILIDQGDTTFSFDLSAPTAFDGHSQFMGLLSVGETKRTDLTTTPNLVSGLETYLGGGTLDVTVSDFCNPPGGPQ